MLKHSHSVRPRLEVLEGREVPANLTVTFSGGTLTVIGDDNPNDVTFRGDVGDKTHFTLTSAGTINNLPSPFSTPGGVKNIVVKMLAGNDTVTFDNSVPIDVLGNLKIDGGNGANSVLTTDLKVEKNFAITNGTNTAGSDQSYLTNLSVGGNLSIKNGDGDTYTVIQRSSAGASTIHGNVKVTNGDGQDLFVLRDTNVGGNVKVNNGHASAGGVAGLTQIFNAYNKVLHSVIGGSVSVSYRDGNMSGIDAIADTEVMGNVTFSHGSGSFSTGIDSYSTTTPVMVHGSLSILGTGSNTVNVGANTGFGHGAGLVVGKKFTVTSGSGNDTLTLNNVHVGSNSKFSLGDGTNTINIDDSVFDGKFRLTTGDGSDTFNLERTVGSHSATEFRKAVLIALGGGADSGYVAYSHTDANQAVVVWSTFVVTGVENWFRDLSQLSFPNGNHIQV